MLKRIALIGDVHGELDQLEKLYSMLGHYSLDDIQHCGDLIDRGPEPAGVVQFCREYGIDGVLGNHESVILHYPNKNGALPKNPDKLRSFTELDKDPRNWEYLRSLPYYKIHSNALLHVHAGYNSYLPFDQQGLMFCTASLIHPDHPRVTRWAEMDKKGRPEWQNRAEGWHPWEDSYNLPYDIVAGHKTYSKGANQRTLKTGQTIVGIDTGGWYNKNLTAVIYPDLIYVSTKTGQFILTD